MLYQTFTKQTNNNKCTVFFFFNRPDGEKLKMISNRKLGPGSLSFTAYESIKVYLYLKRSKYLGILIIYK